MAKRLNIGNVNKSKDPTKSDYIQIRKDLKEPIVLTAGQYIQVESKAYQLASLAKAVELGKISGENAEKAKARIDNIKDWVRAELVLITE